MRIPELWLGVLMFAPVAATAQSADSTRCYDFRAPFFWRIAWNAERRAWARDTTSVVHLTNRPHPPGAMVSPGDRLIMTTLPTADTVMVTRGVTSWRAPDTNHVVINWFTGGATYQIETEIRGDSLVGQLTNHADRVDFSIQRFRVVALRVSCPTLTRPSP